MGLFDDTATTTLDWYWRYGVMSMYQVLTDLRVVKNVFLPGPMPGWGYWHMTEIGKYIYFPSETRWLFVNKPLSEDQTICSSLPANSITLKYCAHRSHTPTTNFAEVLHREPVREEWTKLVRILKELQRRQTEQIRKTPYVYGLCRKRRHGATTSVDSVYSLG